MRSSAPFKHTFEKKNNNSDILFSTVFAVVFLILRVHRLLLTRRTEIKKKGRAEHLKGVAAGGELLKGVVVGGVKATATLISEEDSGGTELIRLKVMNDPPNSKGKGGSEVVKHSRVY